MYLVQTVTGCATAASYRIIDHTPGTGVVERNCFVCLLGNPEWPELRPRQRLCLTASRRENVQDKVERWRRSFAGPTKMAFLTFRWIQFRKVRVVDRLQMDL